MGSLAINHIGWKHRFVTAAAFALPSSSAPSLTRGRAEAASQPLGEHEFRRVYDANAGALLRYLTRSTNNRDLAHDLLQDVFYRYVRSSFRGESDEHRRRYLFKVASNLVVDHYRKRRPQQVALEDIAELPANAQPSIGVDLGAFLAELSTRDRQLVWLAHVEGFSHREIGAIMQLKVPSVRPALFRARKRLVAILERNGIGPEMLSP